MIRSADFAGFVNVVQVGDGETLGDEPGAAISTVNLTVEIVQPLVSGGLTTGDRFGLRVELSGPANADQTSLQQLSTLSESSTVLVALRRIGDGRYRIINDLSIWALGPDGSLLPAVSHYSSEYWRDFIRTYQGRYSSMSEVALKLSEAGVP